MYECSQTVFNLYKKKKKNIKQSSVIQFCFTALLNQSFSSQQNGEERGDNEMEEKQTKWLM